MAMEASEIEKLIREGIPGCEVRIEDLRGDGDHYAAYVTSASFEGKTRIEQHKMVLNSLQGKITKELHALAIQTSVPPE